jgi:aryl-alcohol dehydrogenase-like predicted oxidoreductase
MFRNDDIREDWGWGSDKEESRAVFQAFAEAGGNFLDTANLYTNGTSEILVGEFVKAIEKNG